MFHLIQIYLDKIHLKKVLMKMKNNEVTII